MRPGERGLLLLTVAHPSIPGDALGAWSVGRRDAALLKLRHEMFGPRVTGLASCPQCGELAEIALDVADITLPLTGESTTALTILADGHRVRFRVPNVSEMVALARGDGGRDPTSWLLGGCILDSEVAGTPRATDDLPDAVLSAVAHAMGEADPQADIELSLTCPWCAEPWRAQFDIVTFLWAEIDAWATGLLVDVHALASAFGWSEPETLALSPWRRRHYVEMVAGA